MSRTPAITCLPLSLAPKNCHEALAEAFDFSDPDLWRSNSFASLRPRLVVWMHSVVLDLQCDPVSHIPLMSTRNDLCKRVAQEVMDRFAIGGD
jgi:hypothetical protein